MRIVQRTRIAIVLIGIAYGIHAAEFQFNVQPGGRYLAVPVESGAPKILLEIFENGRRLTYDAVEWARRDPTWVGSLDLGEVKGRTLRFRFS